MIVTECSLIHPYCRKVVVSYADYSKEFAFDQNFGPETTQEEVYNDIAAPLVEQVLNGRSCTVMAYGQTGTGKVREISEKPSSTLPLKAKCGTWGCRHTQWAF